MKNKILFLTIAVAFFINVKAQNVGIGTTTPAYKLDVAGTINTSANAYVAGYVGISTTTPVYKLQVDNGSMALHNTTDNKYWYLSYSSSSDIFYLAEDGVTRLTVANGGNVGIGTTTPAVKLDVNGAANVGSNLTVGSSATVNNNLSVGGSTTVDGSLSASSASVDGNVTVSGGKGILRSWNSSQIKYYTQQSSVHAILPAFGTSVEATIAWPSGIFSNPPQVLVGDITSTVGTTGTLYRVLLIPYNATANSCKFRLINTSNGSVDYDITYNIVLLGN